MKKQKGVVSISLVALGIIGFVVLSAYGLTVVTGKFTALAVDTAAPRTVNTGLTHLRVLRIYVYAPRRPAEIAYTTDQIQADQPGGFLCQTRWLKGLAITGGSFTLSHAMFKRPGVTYYWEALGD